MEIGNFIIIDDKLSAKRCREQKGMYKHTVNGTVYIPINMSIPVIRKGVGCVGIGVVTELTLTGESTTMIFNVFECSEEAANAYYSLYRNQLTTNASAMDDVYDNTDVIIPGAIQNVKPSQSPKKYGYEPDYSRTWGHSSLSDFDNVDSDDVHW